MFKKLTGNSGNQSRLPSAAHAVAEESIKIILILKGIHGIATVILFLFAFGDGSFLYLKRRDSPDRKGPFFSRKSKFRRRKAVV